ncbi:MAG TPA: hypothetical protein VEF92_09080 [Burkholderiales bacterium]|nr:hypothetical protein [Burkholderiales bacterium]HYA47689.1 hypothetical protein [Burkholderiales bacterium]
MTALGSLWLPILVSAVFVFVASSVIHMFLGWHKNDYPKMPDEDGAINALRPLAVPPGDYVVPHCSGPEEMKSPEFREKMSKGPVLIVTVRPNGLPGMGAYLAQWFVFCVVVSIFAGYVASSALPPGTRYLRVFQLVGTSAFMGYAFALWPLSIWYGRSWSTTIKSTADGLVYGFLTAGTFGWLWPR